MNGINRVSRRQIEEIWNQVVAHFTEGVNKHDSVRSRMRRDPIGEDAIVELRRGFDSIVNSRIQQLGIAAWDAPKGGGAYVLRRSVQVGQAAAKIAIRDGNDRINGNHVHEAIHEVRKLAEKVIKRNRRMRDALEASRANADSGAGRGASPTMVIASLTSDAPGADGVVSELALDPRDHPEEWDREEAAWCKFEK